MGRAAQYIALTGILLVAGVIGPPARLVNAVRGLGGPATLDDLGDTFAGDPHIRVVYYDVGGATTEDLRRELDRKGPVDQFGYRRDAYTRWKIRWAWPLDKQRRPAFDRTKASYEIRVFMPRWKPPLNVEPSLLRRWHRYVASMIEHERTHVQFVRANVPAIAQSIRDRAQQNPNFTVDEANALGSSIMKKVQQLDREYDRSTDNGINEGVHL